MIYFLQDRAKLYIKIGFSESVPSRVASLRTASPNELVLLATCEGDRCAEAALHRQFAPYREVGEWFRPAPELIQHIQLVAADGVCHRRNPPRESPCGRHFSSVYLAGKMDYGDDWRHPYIEENGHILQRSGVHEFPDRLPVLNGAFVVPATMDFPEVRMDYVGPFFFNEFHPHDMYCNYWDDAHGNTATAMGDNDSHPVRNYPKIVPLCCDAIERCDLFIANINSLGCYGTIAEIGYAAAIGKTVVFVGRKFFRDMRFVYSMGRGPFWPSDQGCPLRIAFRRLADDGCTFGSTSRQKE